MIINDVMGYDFSNLDFKNNFVEVVTDFLNSNLIIYDDIDKNLLELEKIFTYFERLNHKINIDEIIKLISNCPLLEEIGDITISNYEELKSKDKISNEIELFLKAYRLKNKKEVDFINCDDNLKLYLLDIQNMPLLSTKEEEVLFKKVVENDLSAKKIIVERNLKLVVKIAMRYIGQGFDVLDLIQEGNIALIHAVDNCDYSKCQRFSNYASRCIELYIERKINQTKTIIAIPNNITTNLPKFRECLEGLRLKLKRTPTIEEIAESLKITPLAVKKFLFALDIRRSVSLNETLSNDLPIEFEDFLRDKSLSPEQLYEQKKLKEDLYSLLISCNFKDRDLQILIARFGLDGKEPISDEEITKTYNISRVRGYQIVNSMFTKLNKMDEVIPLIQYLDNGEDILKKRNSLTQKELEVVNRYAFLEIPNKIIINHRDSLSKFFKNYISRNINKKFIQIVGNFINQEITYYNNVEDNILELHKIINFLKRYNYEFKKEGIIILINENKILYYILNSIVNCYLNDIKLKNFDFIENDQFAVGFIDYFYTYYYIDDKDKKEIYYSDELTQYLEEIKNYQALSKNEEQTLFKKLEKNSNNKIIIDKILKSYLRLVVTIATSYYDNDFNFLDLIQEGNIALLNAIKSYKLSMGCNFSSYATYFIKNAIFKEMARNNNFSNETRINISRYKTALSILKNELKRNPTTVEIANKLEMDETTVLELSKLALDFVSLNTPLDNGLELGDVIENKDEMVIDICQNNITHDEIFKLLNSGILNDIELKIMVLHNGFDNGIIMTLKEIADMLNIEYSEVCRMENTAIEKIKKSSVGIKLAYYTSNPSYYIKTMNIPKFGPIKTAISKYSDLEIRKMLSYLTENEIKLFYLKYGIDYLYPQRSICWTSEHSKYFNNILLPKIIRIMDFIKYNTGTKFIVRDPERLEKLTSDVKKEEIKTLLLRK